MSTCLAMKPNATKAPLRSLPALSRGLWADGKCCGHKKFRARNQKSSGRAATILFPYNGEFPMLAFEVYKRHGRGWKTCNVISAADSRKAAGYAGYLYGPGKYRVRPEYSQDKFFAYTVRAAK